MLDGKIVTSIKRAKNEIITTLTGSDSSIGNKIDSAKSSIESKIDALPGVVNEIKSGVTDFKGSFNSWKSDWTGSRANKLDKLDETISSRAKETSLNEVKGELATTKNALDKSIEKAVVEMKKKPTLCRLNTRADLEKMVEDKLVEVINIKGTGEILDLCIKAYEFSGRETLDLGVEFLLDSKVLVRGLLQFEYVNGYKYREFHIAKEDASKNSVGFSPRLFDYFLKDNMEQPFGWISDTSGVSCSNLRFKESVVVRVYKHHNPKANWNGSVTLSYLMEV